MTVSVVFALAGVALLLLGFWYIGLGTLALGGLLALTGK